MATNRVVYTYEELAKRIKEDGGEISGPRTLETAADRARALGLISADDAEETIARYRRRITWDTESG